MDVKRIGKELGVRYALEGSARPSGARVRVTAQLIDAESGAHVWADRFDAARGDLLDMQDEIVTRIARTLHIRLSALYAAQLELAHPEDPDAEVLAMRAEAVFLGQGIVGGEETGACVRLCKAALERDSGNIRALSVLGNALAVQPRLGLSADPEGTMRQAEEVVERALAINPNHYLVHHAKARILVARHSPEEAIVETERALELNPADIGPYLTLARCLFQLGRADDGLTQLDRAIRLSPRDPLLYELYSLKLVMHLMSCQDDQALEWIRRSVALNPLNGAVLAYLAALLGRKGELIQAREHLARYLQIPDAMTTLAVWRSREEASHLIWLSASGSMMGCAARACRRNKTRRRIRSMSANGMVRPCSFPVST
jgi:adenylate cyclase